MTTRNFIIVVLAIGFAGVLGIIKVSNEHSMTKEYARQAQALERIAEILEGKEPRPRVNGIICTDCHTPYTVLRAGSREP